MQDTLKYSANAYKMWQFNKERPHFLVSYVYDFLISIGTKGVECVEYVGESHRSIVDLMLKCLGANNRR